MNYLTPVMTPVNACQFTINLEGLRLLAGDGYLGVTPVDGKALTEASASVKPCPVEAGTFYGFPQER